MFRVSLFIINHSETLLNSESTMCSSTHKFLRANRRVVSSTKRKTLNLLEDL